MPYRWYIVLAAIVRRVYFSSVRIVGSLPRRAQPQVIVSSHRNGAIDGYIVMAAFPAARFLLSAQLLRSRFLRLMFGGIPVVREKDRERHGLRAGDHANPVIAACRQVRAGGSVVMFPEGSSEWGPHPQPYEPGTARIVRMLMSQGAAFEVIPVGLFYRAPDRFRSAVELLVGAPVVLPEQGGATRQDWEARIHRAIADALDAVSPDCPDMASFERVERLARTDADAGASYAQSFKRREREPAGAAPVRRAPSAPWRTLCGLTGCLLLAPVLLVGWIAGRRADGRNTVSFFRIAGGFATALAWLPMLLTLTLIYPLPMLTLIALAVIGWTAFAHQETE